MFLICSAGHGWDSTTIRSPFKRRGGKCGALIAYDRMSGSTYCQRRLKLKPLTFGNQEEEE